MSAAQSLADTITPKSDQLNADDLIAGPLTVRIEGVKRSASPDQPIDVMIAGHRPFRPCKSMRRVMIASWGDKGDDWVGQSMTLYRDPNVKFGGVAVGGIRISHMTGIAERREFMLTTTRAKRAPYVVEPLDTTPHDYPQDEFDANLDTWVAAIVDGKIDVPGLLHRVSAKGVMTTAQRETLEAAVNAATQQEQETPAVSFDVLMQSIQSAADIAELDECEDLARAFDGRTKEGKDIAAAIERRRGELANA